jgi:hypothetical protein
MSVQFVTICSILWPFGIFCGHLVYFVAIWYALWPSGIFYGHLVFFPVSVCCSKKNLATLAATHDSELSHAPTQGSTFAPLLLKRWLQGLLKYFWSL